MARRIWLVNPPKGTNLRKGEDTTHTPSTRSSDLLTDLIKSYSAISFSSWRLGCFLLLFYLRYEHLYVWPFKTQEDYSHLIHCYMFKSLQNERLCKYWLLPPGINPLELTHNTEWWKETELQHTKSCQAMNKYTKEGKNRSFFFKFLIFPPLQIYYWGSLLSWAGPELNACGYGKIRDSY